MTTIPLLQEKSRPSILPIFIGSSQHQRQQSNDSPIITMHGSAMKKSRITLARAILMICTASMMMALLHIHYTSFYNRDIDSYNLAAEIEIPYSKKVTVETQFSTTDSYSNGTISKEFKPAFYKDSKAARKDMGSFLDTLAERASKNHNQETTPSNGYFSYLPMGGGNNQFTSLEKAALLAKDLNRTLIIPPISPSSHIKIWSGPRYSEFYDLKSFSAQSGISILEWHDIKQTPADPPKDLTRHWADFSEDFPCIPNSGIGIDDKNLYDHFRPQFLMNFKSVAPPVMDKTNGGASEYSYVRDVLLQDKNAENPDLWKCISCPYFLTGSRLMDRGWEEVGLHMKFNEKFEAMADDILDRVLPKSQDETRRHSEFIIVHLRRGDIVNKCKNGQSEQECLVQIEQIAEKVDLIEKERRIKALSATNENNANDTLERLPVLVATNEKRPEELEKLEKLGWIMLDHGDKEVDSEGIEIPSKTIKLGTMSSLGEFYPPMLDALLLTRGDYLIGMSNSRMSQLATQRGAAWYGHTTILM
ncbi:hypothetical protein BGX27_005592 [Mortierella sp. AM989]|nr:hypothetical protein BGX27_005592 [Mortierella sp. AM989]